MKKTSFTDSLKTILLNNGFKKRSNTFYEGARGNISVSYTFLGGGWVKKYYREYPATEGWYIKTYRCSDFISPVRPILDLW